MQYRGAAGRGISSLLAGGAKTIGADSGDAGASATPAAWCSQHLYGHTGRHFHAVFAPRQPDAGTSQLLATASEDQSVRVWDAGSGKCIRSMDGAHDDEVLRVGWSRDGSMLATGGADGAAKLWRAQDDWPCIATLDHGKSKQIYGLVFISSSHQQQQEQLLTAYDNNVALWDLGAPNKVAQAWSYPSIGSGPSHGGVSRNPDAVADVFDVAIAGEPTQGGGKVVDHHLLAAALGDGSVRVVDPRSPSVVAVLLNLMPGADSGVALPAATGVAFSPSAKELVSCDTAGYARVWDCRAWGRARHTVAPTAASAGLSPLFGCTFWPPNGQSSNPLSAGEAFLVWSSSGLLSGFDVSDGLSLGSLMCGSASPKGEEGQQAQQYPVYDVAIAADTTYVCAAGGRSEQQQQRTAGSVQNQKGWGVPVQLWRATDSDDGSAENGANRDSDKSARRPTKRPRTSTAPVASLANEDSSSIGWLTDFEDKD